MAQAPRVVPNGGKRRTLQVRCSGSILSGRTLNIIGLDLKQKREKVTAELVEVQRAKRRLANDEQVLAQLAGLESRLAYARQDEVFTFHDMV